MCIWELILHLPCWTTAPFPLAQPVLNWFIQQATWTRSGGEHLAACVCAADVREQSEERLWRMLITVRDWTTCTLDLVYRADQTPQARGLCKTWFIGMGLTCARLRSCFLMRKGKLSFYLVGLKLINGNYKTRSRCVFLPRLASLMFLTASSTAGRRMNVLWVLMGFFWDIYVKMMQNVYLLNSEETVLQGTEPCLL